jgi:hypothetical protein
MSIRIDSIALGACLVLGLAGASPAHAQSPLCYTVESLQGTFATIGTYGSKMAIAFGVREHDAQGNVLGIFTNNQPVVGSPTGARTITTGVNRGSMTVNCDGTGVVTRVATLGNGSTSIGYDDLLITESVVRNGKLIATAFEDAQRVPSASVPGGIFLSRKHTRRPDSQTAGCYTLESLRGTYSVIVNYDVNAAMALQKEYLDGEGNLWRTGPNNQPVAGSPTGERTIGQVTSAGTYTVECSGRGTITRTVTRPDGTKATAMDDFLILKAVEEGGRLRATVIFDGQRDPALVGPNPAFVTRTHTLLADASADLESRLQSLACGSAAAAQSCRVTVNVWNYYFNSLNPAATPLTLGDGNEVMSIHRYFLSRAAAGL